LLQLPSGFQLKMSNLTCIIRNYHSEDFDKLVRLGTDVEERGQTGCLISPLDLIESLGQPNHSSENNLFIAERAGEIVGYADVSPELNVGRAVLRWLVHPKHRRRRIAAKLVDRASSRIRELGIKTIHVNILQNSPMAKRLLTKMGFTLIRRYLELRLDLSKALLPEISKICPRCRPLQPGEEERLTQLQNRSFSGAWGYNANTVEEIIYRTRLPNCSPEDIIMAFDWDKPVGYCWTRINFWKNKAPGEGAGRIYMLGVDPDYRGRGSGKQLLLAGLSYLKRKGLRVVELTVDSENKVACALYKSVGFKLWTSSLWYEKRLT
jgi:mycothiol synthase